MNGDGRPDAVAGAGDAAHVDVFLGGPDGLLHFSYTNRTFYIGSSAVLADFNGDGNLDLAGSYGGGGVAVALGVGGGAFHFPVPPQGYYQLPGSRLVLAAADFDGDGYSDLAVAVYDHNTVAVFRGSANGTLVGPVTYAVGNHPIAIMSADVDGDGHLDIPVANYSAASVSVLRGHGDGTFQAATSSNVLPDPGYGLPRALAAGDFNGDARLDLAVTMVDSSYSYGFLSVVLGRGDGSFGPPVEVPATPATSIVAADFNGDTATDLALGSSSGVFFFQGTGDGTFRFSGVIQAATALLALADLHAATRPDLVTLGYGGYLIRNCLRDGRL